MRYPSDGTLKKYGLTLADWKVMWKKQGERCPICARGDKTLVIDHEHVRGWAKMPPSERRKYVRGILCQWCNYRILRRGITLQKLQRAAIYLRAYERKKNG